MAHIRQVACVLLLCLTVTQCEEREKRDGEVFNVPGRPERGKIDFQLLNNLRQAQGEGGDDLEYRRYLKELMANNPELAQKFANMRPDQVAKRFSSMRGKTLDGARSHLDEAKRMTVEELKELQRARMLQQAIEEGKLPPRMGQLPLRGQQPLGGYDPKVAMDMMRNKRLSPDGGQVNIQERMAEFRRKQEELDQQRHNEFKKHEMKIEHLRRKKLKEMDEVQRLKEEERLQQLFEERRKHEPLVHPASREQLEDVWKKHDGLRDEDFNPKTFFHLHDTNSDGQLDIYEVEALFRRELEKVYRGRMDSIPAMEDLLEMRQHVFSEVDQDRDGLLSLAEFMIYTNREIFDVKEEWKPVVDKNTEDIFNDKEMEQYEEDYDENEDYDYDYDDYGNIIQNPKKHQQEEEQRQKVEQDQQQQQQHQEQQNVQEKLQDQRQWSQEQQVQPVLEAQIEQQEMLLKHLQELQQPPQQGGNQKQSAEQQQLEEHRERVEKKLEHLKQMRDEAQQRLEQSRQPVSDQKTANDADSDAPVREEKLQQDEFQKNPGLEAGQDAGQPISDQVAGNQQL